LLQPLLLLLQRRICVQQNLLELVGHAFKFLQNGNLLLLQIRLGKGIALIEKRISEVFRLCCSKLEQIFSTRELFTQRGDALRETSVINFCRPGDFEPQVRLFPEAGRVQTSLDAFSGNLVIK